MRSTCLFSSVAMQGKKPVCRQESAQPSVLGHFEDGSCPGFGTWPLERATRPRLCCGGVRGNSGQQRTLVLQSENSHLAGSSQLFLIQTRHRIHSAVSSTRTEQQDSIAKSPQEAERLPWLCPSHLVPG